MRRLFSVNGADPLLGAEEGEDWCLAGAVN